MTVVCLGYRKGFADAARRRGLPVHFVSEKPKAALAAHPHSLVGDLADPEEVLRAVRSAVGRSVTAVVTGHEQALFTAALLRSALGLPGDADPAGCLRFRDKHVQKAALPPEIRRARCVYLGRPPVRFADLAARLGPRVVVKPADGFGSQATRLVRDQAQLDAYLARHPVRSDVQTVAESFNEGAEIHVDGVWSHGKPVWLTVSTYLGSLMGWTEGTVVGDLPFGAAEPELTARAGRLATEVLTALAAPDCVFHLEAFVAPDGGLVFGEAAVRLAGGLTPEILARSYGVDLFGAALDAALGRPPEVPPADRVPERLFGYVFLTRDPDRELTEADFRDRFDLVDLDYPAADAGRIGSYGRWGHAMASAPTHAELARTLREIADFNRGVGRAGA